MATNSPKSRDYFITINQGAECYDDVLNIVQELNYKLYAFIVHDKDYIVNDDGTTTLKPTHKHVVFELANPLSFNSIQNKFKGAHIVAPKFKKSAYQYLLHNTNNSKEKYQYDFDEIITNNANQLKFIIESETHELFYENQFLLYWAQGTRTPYQFTCRFGLNAYKQYWRAYLEVFATAEHDVELQNDIRQMEETLKKDQELDLPF